MSDTDQLRELHDRYAWQVNAAVGAGRLDLVSELADQFVDEVAAFVTDAEGATCGRADCAVCAGRRRPVTSRGRGSRGRLRRPWRPPEGRAR
jgi:hypothetical protein